MKAIHQIVAGFTNGDAISNEALVLRDVFRSWGFKSDIFCESKRILPELRSQALDIKTCQSSCLADDVALLHLSIGSAVNDIFPSLNCKKAILYHNITPPHYFNLINRQTAMDLEKGQRQVAALANVAQVNMADSRFNANELAPLGYTNVHVLPLVLDLEKLKASPDRKILRIYDNDTTNILFVGRCAPNKKIEDLITAFYYYHKYVDPNSRLLYVGSFAGTERYYHLLLTQIRELDLSCVHFTGSIPQSHVNAFYKCADLFLSMSEHEGFCIPVLESMVHNVPVLAYANAAVPETMDGAGVLFKEKKIELVAEMMGRMVHDSEFRNAVIKKQKERLARYTGRNLASELRQMLDPILRA